MFEYYTYIWLIAFFRFWTPGFVVLWRLRMDMRTYYKADKVEEN